MTRTRSGKGKESTSESGETTYTERTTTENTTSGTENTSDSSASTSETLTADTSGIKATPAPSTASVMERPPEQQQLQQQELMPPPATAAAHPPKPARSRRSGAPSKRLLAELGAKEKLAELELRRIQAEAALEKIRQQQIEAELTEIDSEDEEADDLAPQRVSDWFTKQPTQEQQHPPVEAAQLKEQQQEVIEIQQDEEDQRGQAVRVHKIHRRQQEAQPCQSALDVTSLATALTEAIHSSKSTRRYIPELPQFSGQCQEWLQFKAAYKESEASFTASENVSRIRRSLKGAALEAVSALLISQPQPEDIVNSLERRFGRPDALLLGEMERMKTLPRLTDNARDLCVFASRIANTVATIEVLKRPQYLYNPEVLRIIVDKLTPIIRNKWYDYATTNPNTPELKKMADFLNHEADKCAPYAPLEQAVEISKPAKRRIERAYTAATEINKKTDWKEKTSCPLCHQEGHLLPACPRFNKADTNERWEIAKKNHMCYRCLASKHNRYICRAKPCGRNGCPMRHHRLLHHERAPQSAVTTSSSPSPTQTEHVMASSTTEVVASNRTSGTRAYLKIVPVTLHGPETTIKTFALLDEGSTVTIIDSTIADILGLDGPNEPMWVQGVSGTEIAHKKSKRVSFTIRGRHNNNKLQVDNAHTVSSLDFTTQTISEREVDDCQHLQEIKEELLYTNATPKILIGQDNWELIVSRDIKQGRRDQPVASHTLLGWVLHGCRTSHAAPVAYCCTHLTTTEPQESMDEMMRRYFTLESLSIAPKRQESDPAVKALKQLDQKSRRLPDGRFETGLLWREETHDIPNNRASALKRLYTLERKLDRDDKLKKQYNERIENLLTSHYAERAAAPPSGRTWYLPHFAVCNPEKPKIRVVHDAAAASHGRSLNDMLLPGPDLLQSLPGVIMRFRQHGIAVSADIKEMFMQIKIREEDRDALRFLWRGDRREGEPDEYRMTSVIFGASSSPCTALYIKNRNAHEHAARYPQAARAIERNHYMDDYLQSFDTTQEARQVTRDVDHVHKQAGFQLRGWATNEREALREVVGEERDGNTVPIGGSEMEKTLGLLWNTKEDSLRFRLNSRRAPPEVLDDLRPPTKREALSVIMSIFDPLGLISPLTTPAKRIMQDAWRYKTDWDEPIPEELRERWSAWLRQLRNLDTLSVPRCYDAAPAARYELHTFADASEEAYAAAVYWRMERADGSVKVALATGKSRVTPTKPVSIPRLELQAAILGVRLARTVAEEHEYELNTTTYWSDSRTALAWIRAEPRTYKTFVAHRLAEIEEHTRKNEWRWVPSAHNPADDATRATPADFNQEHRWFVGPSFLYEEASTWPREHKVEVPPTGEEKQVCGATRQQEPPTSAPVPQAERFSSWTRLVRATARMLQFVDLLRNRPRAPVQIVAAARRKRTRANEERDGAWNKTTKHTRTAAAPVPATETRKFIALEAAHLIAAERLLIRASQEQSYAKERRRIAEGRVPDKDDRLAQLSVYLDEDSIVRLRSRITAADNLQEETVHPIVLCGRQQHTKLYVLYVHEKLHHGGTETVVNELRQRMHIVKIRPTVKEVIARCPKCRLRRAKPAAPSTGDLPAARLAHHTRPFSYTGLDYYGPQEVTVGRHKEKRYVALFTCLTSRAVHLELVASLSTDAAINALRRFIARRGCPTELWSDNATAFRGAYRELAAALQDAAHARRINWRFLPPAAPFMAGAWERMVRTVKEAMKTTLHEKYPSEETLLTLLAEAEATVNSRPLTYVPVTHDDPPALTPNMILLGPDCYNPAPGTFEKNDADARQHWRRAQQLADTFWRRWVREYAPLLRHRREPYDVGVSPAVGDIVIVCDSNLPRNTWPRGRVTKIYPGKDGTVRVADVTTSRGHVLRRPTKKIVVLPVNSLSDGGRNVNDDSPE